jgi:hypothetical protein
MAAAKGGARPGAGRKPGVPNKATADIRALAQQWGPEALEAAAAMAGIIRKEGVAKAESEQVRLAALNLLLDRGYGKAPQAITGEGGEGPVLIKQLLESVDGRTRGIPAGC